MCTGVYTHECMYIYIQTYMLYTLITHKYICNVYSM